MQKLVDFQLHYEKNLANYRALEEEAKHIILTRIREEQFQIHHIHSRIKEFNSCLLKVLEHETVELTDILGLRIVCLFLSDMNQVGDIISKTLNVLSFDDKIANSATDEFGYFSHHYIVTLKENYHGPRYENIKNIKFEIQVRTIAMDAWANISHYLSYKPSAEISNDIKKELYSTSAIFYLADRNFERIFSLNFKELRSLTKRFVASTPKELHDVEISSVNMTAFLRAKFPSRISGYGKAVENLVIDLRMAGYKTLGTIYERILEMTQIISLYETEVQKGFNLADVAMVNTVMMISDSKFRRIFYPDITHRKQVAKHYKKYELLWKKQKKNEFNQ